MELIKIGNDYYNLEFLISIESNKNKTVSLYFLEDKKVTITDANWENLNQQIGEFVKYGTDNDYKPRAGVF